MQLISPAALAGREQVLSNFVRSNLIESHGLVMSAVDADTGKPFTPDTFGPHVDHMRHPPMQAQNFGDYFAYENCGMATGAWLAAQACKYATTHDPAALEAARTAATALLNLYDLSQEVAPGFFSKFHEGKLSREISTDQCLYALWGLNRYLPFASGEEESRIAKMSEGIATFWRDRDYKHPYRERDFDWQWPLNRFPPILWLAWTHTKKPAFRDEYLRLVDMPQVRANPPFLPNTRAQWRLKNPGGNAHWPFKLCNGGQGGISLEALLRTGAPPPQLWLDHLEELISATLPDLDENCLGRGHFFYNEETGVATDVDRGYHAAGKPNTVWEAKYYVSAARSGHHPTMYARALMCADRHLPGRGLAKKALEILHKIDLPLMLEKIDLHNHLPANQRWMTRCLSGDGVVNWIWAYWIHVERESRPEPLEDC